jgi:hypothetical protein
MNVSNHTIKLFHQTQHTISLHQQITQSTSSLENISTFINNQLHLLISDPKNITLDYQQSIIKILLTHIQNLKTIVYQNLLSHPILQGIRTESLIIIEQNANANLQLIQKIQNS